MWVEQVRSTAGTWQVYGGCSEAWAAHQCNRNRQVRSSGKINYTMSQSAFCHEDEDIQWGRWINFEGWVWLLQIEGSARVVVVVFNTVTPSRDLCQQSAACSQSTYARVCVCVCACVSIKESESPPPRCPGCEPLGAKSRLQSISDYYQETQDKQRTQDLTRRALLAPIIRRQNLLYLALMYWLRLQSNASSS